VESGRTDEMLEENVERKGLSPPSDRGVRTTEESRGLGTRGVSIRELKADLSLLKKDRNWGKSALISWGQQTRQVFFDETEAIPMLTKKIKEI
jgi:hypothetical protein